MKYEDKDVQVNIGDEINIAVSKNWKNHLTGKVIEANWNNGWIIKVNDGEKEVIWNQYGTFEDGSVNYKTLGDWGHITKVNGIDVTCLENRISKRLVGSEQWITIVNKLREDKNYNEIIEKVAEDNKVNKVFIEEFELDKFTFENYEEKLDEILNKIIGLLDEDVFKATKILSYIVGLNVNGFPEKNN